MRQGLARFSSALNETPTWLLLAGALAVIFYCVNAVHYGQLPLRIEENEWPPMAEAIFRSGEPVIAADETHRVRFTEDLRVDQGPFIGAWHPPLYLYTLAASMAVIGTDSPHALRAVGAAGLLISALLLLLIAREVTPRWRIVGGVAAILLLVHPYAIQGSVFLDIDTSVYAPPALLLIWLAIRHGKRPDRLTVAQVIALGSALALVTWVKMPTTIVLACVLALWWLLSRRPFRRAVVEAAAFIAVGTALFFSTYGLWSLATGIRFSYTFDVTFGKSDRLFSDLSLVENAAHWHLRWFGAAVILLGLVYLVTLLRHLWSEQRLRPLDLPFLVSVAVLVQYVALAPTDGTYQGKYAFPALAAMLLPISWMLLRERTERHQRLALWTVALALGLGGALLLPDVLTGLSFYGDYGSWGFELRLAAIAGTALLLAWWLGGKRGFPEGVVVVLAMLLAAQAAHSYRANTSPMYPIPDTMDFGAAAHDLNQTLEEGEIAVAPKDLGFYLQQRVIEGEDAFARGDGRLAATIRRYPEITAFARGSFGPPVGPETEAVLAECFRDPRVFGTASVAYRSGACD